MNRLLACFCTFALISVPAFSAEEDTSWIERSNAFSALTNTYYLDFDPEWGSSLGVVTYDTEIVDLKPNRFERRQAAGQATLEALAQALEAETDHRVQQDLRILIEDVEGSLRTSQVFHRTMLGYLDLHRLVFGSVQSLCNPQNPVERRQAIVERLHQYAGLVKGTTPVTELAKDRWEERAESEDLIGPYRAEVESELERASALSKGIEEILRSSGVEGWESSWQALQEQLEAYSSWVGETVLPRCREDHLLPPEIYATRLWEYGVDEDPRILIEQAQFAFAEIRGEMEALARRIAEERGWDETDYRAVLRRLTKDQIPEDEVIALYRERLATIEQWIREYDIITLPRRDAFIRLATPAEAAVVPAPHMRAPRFIGNTGEYGEFILVTSGTGNTGAMTDFTHEHAAWTLTAHEARPGHELQFASVIENGASIARAVVARNSANMEGWALYMEAVMKEHFPLEGQLFGLQHRLMRAARAFLDPMLNLGQMDRETAWRVLKNEVCLSDAMAQQEIERYMFRMPGQATSYFYGYRQLRSLRTETELALGDRFDQRAYHDFLLAQGFLPPDLLRQAVRDEFVPAHRPPTR